ncbi:hypothetical protein TNCV_1054131 [Trichonephila clavipes]|nr:hypothetical protein TNCV_1054131 [Trichonephila clavipes]
MEGSASLHSQGCPQRLLKRAALRDQSSRPPRVVPRPTLYVSRAVLGMKQLKVFNIAAKKRNPWTANRFPNMRVLVPKVRTPQAPKVSVMSIVFNVVSPITSYFASFFF